MARPVILAAWASALSVALAGCGTMENLTTHDGHSQEVYGGVQRDWDNAKKVFKGDCLPQNQVSYYVGSIFAGLYLAIDLPLSAVADTVTLPATAGDSSKKQEMAAKTAIVAAPDTNAGQPQLSDPPKESPSPRQ
jgi:uncharacterized protein YceK